MYWTFSSLTLHLHVKEVSFTAVHRPYRHGDGLQGVFLVWQLKPKKPFEHLDAFKLTIKLKIT